MVIKMIQKSPQRQKNPKNSKSRRFTAKPPTSHHAKSSATILASITISSRKWARGTIVEQKSPKSVEGPRNQTFLQHRVIKLAENFKRINPFPTLFHPVCFHCTTHSTIKTLFPRSTRIDIEKKKTYKKKQVVLVFYRRRLRIQCGQ